MNTTPHPRTRAPRWIRSVDRTSRCKRLAGPILAAVVAMMGAAPAIASAQTATSPTLSAMNGWSLYGLTPDQLNTQLAAMRARGVRVVRNDAAWGATELTPPDRWGRITYNFWNEDAQVAALASHGITWLPVIDYSAPWAASIPGDWRSPPADNAQFAGFAAAVAARYGVGGAFWAQHPELPYQPVHMYEVWNEENTQYFWDTGPDPVAYANLYLTTRAAIRAVDAKAQVLIGGLTNPEHGTTATTYLRQMFQAVPALVGNVDGVGLHPYAYNAAGVIQDVQNLRWVLDSVGASAVPIEATEFGWQVGTQAQERVRAAYMSTVAQSLARSNCNVGLLAPYDWENPAYVAWGGDWGLAGASGLRPAGSAWFAGLNAASRRAPAIVCATPQQVAQAIRLGGAGSQPHAITIAASRAQRQSVRRHGRRRHHRTHQRKRHHRIRRETAAAYGRA